MKKENIKLETCFVVLGAASGPFLFKASGLVEFPRFFLPDYVIVICYVVGASVVFKWLYLAFIKLYQITSNSEL